MSNGRDELNFEFQTSCWTIFKVAQDEIDIKSESKIDKQQFVTKIDTKNYAKHSSFTFS